MVLGSIPARSSIHNTHTHVQMQMQSLALVLLCPVFSQVGDDNGDGEVFGVGGGNIVVVVITAIQLKARKYPMQP